MPKRHTYYTTRCMYFAHRQVSTEGPPRTNSKPPSPPLHHMHDPRPDGDNVFDGTSGFVATPPEINDLRIRPKESQPGISPLMRAGTLD